jgi:carboxyl-terminal processing protease
MSIRRNTRCEAIGRSTIARLTRASLVSTLVWPTTAHAQGSPDADTLSLAFRTAFAAELDAVIRTKFAHWDGVPGLRGARYDSLARAYRAEVASTNDRRAFGLATMRLLGALQNGHTTYTDPWLQRRHGAWQGFRVGVDSLGWIVTMSQTPGLTRGDRVTHIDSMPFEQFYQRQRPYLMQSGDRAARYALSNASYLFPAALTLTLEGGRQVRIVRTPPAASTGAATRTQSADTNQRVTTPSVRRSPVRWLVPDSIAVVRLATFSDGGRAEREALAALRGDLAKASAVIFDVRDNGGGQTPWRLIKALTGSAFAGFQYRPDHVGSANWLQRIGARFVRTGRYRGRVAVLANIGCASACENFVMALQSRAGAVFVGDTTWGSTGQPVFVDGEHGIVARVSARRAIGPNGTTFEGVGLIPDVVVRTPVGVLGGDGDPVLNRAVAVLRRPAAP